jgi:[acyl-carrier-protein] S-malonyltransferase
MIAFVFPGQGAQYVGMGQSIAARFPATADLFARAGAVLGFDLLTLCAEGPEERLHATENTQPAVLVTDLACAAALAAHGVRPDVVAGLSLGEYAALVSAGVMGFEDAVRLVRQRGLFMQEATAGREVAMAAVIGLEAEKVERLCAEHRHLGVVEPANYNGAGQIVIGGDAPAVRAAVGAAKAAGARRAVLLGVSAPFHTSLMVPAAERLAAVLERVPLADAAPPVVSNVTAEPVRPAEEIRRLLVRQVAAPVRWEASVRRMVAMGVSVFVEVGPGTSLSGLIKKTVAATVLHVEDVPTLEQTLQRLDVRVTS